MRINKRKTITLKVDKSIYNDFLQMISNEYSNDKVMIRRKKRKLPFVSDKEQ